MAEDDQKPQVRPRHTVTLGASRSSAVNYGAIEFLRAHPKWRVLAAVLGIAAGLIAIDLMVTTGHAGLKVAYPYLNLPLFLGFLIAPWLLWIAAVSGPDFQLVFPVAQASNERRLAEKEFEESNTPEDALKVDLKRLNEYYVINQAQARSSFRWAVFSMFVGFGTIIVGVWLFYFRSTQPDKFMAGLSTAAGCIVNLISGLFLYLHSKTQDRSLLYYEQLARLQKVSIAIRLVEAHWDPAKQTEARDLVIRELLASSK
jgi:hypothetical protein